MQATLDLSQRQALATEHYFLVGQSLRKRSGRAFPRLGDEIESAANAGLWSAALLYDPSLGPFAAYAATTIQNRIRDALRLDRRAKSDSRKETPIHKVTTNVHPGDPDAMRDARSRSLTYVESGPMLLDATEEADRIIGVVSGHLRGPLIELIMAGVKVYPASRELGWAKSLLQRRIAKAKAALARSDAARSPTDYARPDLFPGGPHGQD